ncbi:MAG TPA: hypothetical protein VNW99_05030 [Cytophagaceae bacterium]|nr:hypothetical protein [Cytophagaceae bacterium]
MNYVILTYLVYLSVSIILTILVANVLFKNGRIFLVDIFAGNEPLADSVNKLLLVGFYLVNIGYASLALKEDFGIENYQVVIERLSYKIGVIVLLLGAMHFFNLFVFYKLRKRAQQSRQFDYNSNEQLR